MIIKKYFVFLSLMLLSPIQLLLSNYTNTELASSFKTLSLFSLKKLFESNIKLN